MSSARRDGRQQSRGRGAHAARSRDGTAPPRRRDAVVWLDVTRELVITLTAGPRLLLASVASGESPELAALLDRLRRGGRQPEGSARWIPEWQDSSLSAMRLRANLETDAAMSLGLRFVLPRCHRTLGALPERIAVTDTAGFAELERTRGLPCAVLLPVAARDVLAEHIAIDSSAG